MQEGSPQDEGGVITPVVEEEPATTKNTYFPKLFKTVTFCYVFVMLGFAIASLGPSLLHLSTNVNYPLDDMGILFTLKGLSYVVTALLVGFVMDNYSIHAAKPIKPKNRVLAYILERIEFFLLVTALVLMAVGLLIMPFLKNIVLLVAVNFMIGIANGIVDCVCNIVLIWIWGPEEVNPYMQALHFCFGLGAFIAPLFIQISETALRKLNGATRWPWLNPLIPAYLAMVVLILSAIVAVFLSKMSKYENNGTSDSTTLVGQDALAQNNSGESLNETPQESFWQRSIEKVKDRGFMKQIFVSILSSIALMLYVGCEVSYGGLITSFVTIYHKDDFEFTASLLASMFWLTFTIGRLIAIPISKYVSVRVMLIADIIVAMSAICVLVFTEHKIAIWVATLVAGIGMASQYPSTMSLPSAHLNMNLSGFMTSLMVVFGALGELIVPAVMVKYLRHTMLILLCICGSASGIYFVLLFLIPKDKNSTVEATLESEQQQQQEQQQEELTDLTDKESLAIESDGL